MSKATEENMQNNETVVAAEDTKKPAPAKKSKEKTEKSKTDKVKAIKEKVEKAKADKEKADKVKAEKAKADKEKAEKAKAEKAKADKEKNEKAKAEKAEKAEKAKSVKAEKAKAEKEKSEKAKAEKAEKAEKTKTEKAVKAKAKSEKPKIEKTKTTAKKAEDTTIEASKTTNSEEVKPAEKTETKAKKTSTTKKITKPKSEKAAIDKEKSEKSKTKKTKPPEKSEDKVKTEDKAKTETKSKSKKISTKTSTKTSTDKVPAEKKPQGEKKSKIKMLGGYLFAKMMRGGASELRANAEEVNKLNVFPVPDGDTGDNMSMTIQSGVASLDNIDTDDLAEVLKVASRGMLLGARGNSGVILSQFFAGMSKGVENVENADAKTLAHALELGVEQAYGSVMTPTEGTILTVARESVEYAVKRLNSKSTVQSLFSDLVNEMHASLERTPEILPILSEAGVVDSGGAGLFYIIDGLNRVLNGEDIDENEIESFKKPQASSALEGGSFGPDSDMEFGYCTELLVQLMNKKIKDNHFDLDALKIFLATIGDSIVAFQTESIVKIHVHTLRPDKVMKYMHKFGEFITVKIENMSLQHTELEAGEKKEAEPEVVLPKKKYGIVAVSNGVGISNLFRELGADGIVEGGQTNNPSTNDFIDSFKRINAEHIFVFPNNGNIIMAASQAAEIYTDAKVHVVPSKSIGAGYVALASMNFDGSKPDGLMAEAEEAIARITAAYISPAVRDADMNGVHVTDGDTMGIVNKEIVISGPDKMASTYGLIDIMLAGGDKFMITIFYGKDATSEERDMLSEYMMNTYPLIEAYYVDGGQEIYPFLFVVE